MTNLRREASVLPTESIIIYWLCVLTKGFDLENHDSILTTKT